MTDVSIEPVQSTHRADWLELYAGYADHYQIALTTRGIETTWGWLMDADHPTTGLVALSGGKLVGLAHFGATPSPLLGENIGYLNDLFVSTGDRGSGIAERLIQAVRDEGARQHWKVIRWMTRDDNYRARGVYDRVAEKTDWNVYELKCI
jgi:GNAT superfamily N-acetyltransferase